MNVDNISDVLFSISNNVFRNQEVNFKFIYNSYEKNETSLTDDVIFNRPLRLLTKTKKNKFIRITLENNEKSIYTRNISLNNYINKINSIITPLSNISIKSNNREAFNKLDNLMPERMHLLIDNKYKEYERYTDLYDTNNSINAVSDFNKNNRSNKISLVNDNLYVESFLKKDYVENFNYKNLKDYDSLVKSDSIDKARKNKTKFINNYKSGNIFPGLNYISRSINFGDAQEYSDYNGIHCGIYVEKFVKKENDYNFLVGKFYNKVLDTKPSDDSEFIIEDEAVNYGKTYRYTVYNVYFFSNIDPENRFIIKHYMLCSHPYISNDIVCKEFKKPPPPVGLSAIYDIESNTLNISWQSPSNYESDIRGYQVLRRNSIDEPFTVVKQLEGHYKTDFYERKEIVNINDIIVTPGIVPNEFFDKSFDVNKSSIYTVRSIDAHGMVSDYGIQSRIYYDFIRNKTEVSVVSSSGSNVLYPNENLLNSSSFVTEEANIIDNLPTVNNPKKISLYIAPDFAYITNNSIENKIIDGSYQFTFSNLNSTTYRSDIFTIRNFG